MSKKRHGAQMDKIDRRQFLKQVSMLTGFTLTTASWSAVLSSCAKKSKMLTLFEQDFGFASRKNLLLDAKNFYAIVDELTEVIIPITDTPGAKDARVVDFVDGMISVVYGKRDREFFLEGIAHTDSLARSMFKNAFVQCSEQEKIAVVKKLEQESASKQNDFFEKIKGLTIAGFFTSQIGATQVLKHIDVPGRYETVPYAEIGKAWSQ